MQRVDQKLIYIIGGPGSGKGTQCNILKEKLNYHHISTGDLVRARIKKAEAEHDESELSRNIRETTQAGKLLPDDLILDMLVEEMNKHPEAAGFLIDGCPRTMEQAKIFEQRLRKPDHTIYLNAPENEMVKRLLARAQVEHRDDDNAETIAKRLKAFNDKTRPVIDYLHKDAADRFMEVDAMGEIADINDKIVHALQMSNEMTTISFVEMMQLYFSCGNLCDAVKELERRYHTRDFEITFAYVPMMYIMQNKDSVKAVLSANTRTGFQNNNFDVSSGHYLNINATQAFSGEHSMSFNPLWHHIHKGLLHSVGTRESVTKLLDKHMHLMFTRQEFSLDKTMEHCLLSFWCEYIFGSTAELDQFIKTRDKLLRAMSYSFYGNSLKNTPYLGQLTCRFYGWMKGTEFKEVDEELRDFVLNAKSGIFYEFHQYLLASDFPRDQIEQALIDNAFDFILVFDFINNALYETMANIVKNNITDDARRRDSFAPGLRSAFLFPYRVRIPQQEIQINDKAVAKGAYVFVNLLESGLYHSYGPRACVGNSVTTWIKDRFFDQIKNMSFSIVETTHPKERQRLLHCADVPLSPERFEVSWNYPRDYLQRVLPSYEFKNVKNFYDVLKAFEDPRLFGYTVAAFVNAIEKLNIDRDKLVIVAPEVRGVPIAAAVARELNAEQVMIRKPGKIPGPVINRSYQNAYSSETLEISRNSDLQGKHVILIDDGVASGGTTEMCCRLVEELGGEIKGICAMIDHQYKEKVPQLKAYSDRITTLFDFVKEPANQLGVTAKL